MDKIFEFIVDYSLLIAECYLLIRISLSKNPYFKSQFFFFFIFTGALGCLANVGFFLIIRNPPLAENAWIYTAGSFINAFGALGSTIGKLYIVAHRYAVMRSVHMMENIWSNRLTFILTGVLLVLTFIRSIHVFLCEYAFTIRGGVLLATMFDDGCNFREKTVSSLSYIIFIIASIVLTIMTMRELYMNQQRSELETRRIIIKQQRNLIIIVLDCTISHVLKAIHQYVYPHYLATYSASITLIIVSPRVRKLLVSRKDVVERSHAARTTEGTTPTF